MTAPERPVGEDDIQAFIDGRLPADRRAAVDAYFAAHPAAAEQAAADIEIAGLLRTHLAEMATAPIPARLRVRNLMEGRRRRAQSRTRSLAAAAACLLIGIAIGWLGRAPFETSSAAPAARLTSDAITAYRVYAVDKLHPVEVRADQEAHLVQWLSRRIGRPLTAPDLTAEGYGLIGGRLLAAEAGPAALFMYADTAGKRLTLYARADGPAAETGFRFERNGDVSAFSWIDRDLSFVVAGETERARLLSVAEASYRQFALAATGQP